jgi:hypothetical protein
MKFLFSLSKNNFAAIQSKPNCKVACYTCAQSSKASEVTEFIVEHNQKKTALCPICRTDSLVLMLRLADQIKFNRLMRNLDDLDQSNDVVLVANDDVEEITRSKKVGRNLTATIKYSFSKLRSEKIENRRRQLLKIEVSRTETRAFNV